MFKNFIFKLKVYYEDTDSGGVVYYANYLKFLERARSELIYSFGLSNKKLLKEYDTLIIVKSCNIQYKKPAKLEDELEIDSKIKSFTKTSFTIDQTIKRKEEIISLAEIVLVTVDKSGKPIKIPKILANFIK
jgi:acyl-CoA thioester hydrolase